jgi:hypothetical protein
MSEINVKKNVRNYDNTTLAVRLKPPEAVRFWELMDRAKAKDSYIDKSDVIRELLGLSPPNILTRAEIEYFRTGKK